MARNEVEYRISLRDARIIRDNYAPSRLSTWVVRDLVDWQLCELPAVSAFGSFSRLEAAGHGADLFANALAVRRRRRVRVAESSCC